MEFTDHWRVSFRVYSRREFKRKKKKAKLWNERTGPREWGIGKLIVEELFYTSDSQTWGSELVSPAGPPMKCPGASWVQSCLSSASRQLCIRKSKISGSWDCFWYFWSLARTEPRTFLTSGQESRSQSFLTHFPLLSPSCWRSRLYLWCYWCSHCGSNSILLKWFPPCCLHRSPVSCFRTLVLAISPPQMPFLFSVHCQVLNACFFFWLYTYNIKLIILGVWLIVSKYIYIE